MRIFSEICQAASTGILLGLDTSLPQKYCCLWSHPKTQKSVKDHKIFNSIKYQNLIETPKATECIEACTLQHQDIVYCLL